MQFNTKGKTYFDYPLQANQDTTAIPTNQKNPSPTYQVPSMRNANLDKK